MKFFEFGKTNERTRLWLCGYGECWKPALLPFIREAQQKYHVIVDAYDGFNPDEPETFFLSIYEEAKTVCEFLINNFNGRIDVIYGVSLGGMVANEILSDDRIICHTFIADGYTIMNLPDIKGEPMKKLFYSTYASIEYFLLQKQMKIIAKMLGRNADELKRGFYMNVKKESLYNCERSLNGYRYKYKTFNCTNSHIWHADTEKKSIRRVLKLKQSGIQFTHKIFCNVGHGGLPVANPQLVIAEIEKAYSKKVRL